MDEKVQEAFKTTVSYTTQAVFDALAQESNFESDDPAVDTMLKNRKNQLEAALMTIEQYIDTL